MRRIIDSKNPLFHFKGTPWDTVPAAYRPYSAVAVDAMHFKKAELAELREMNIPVVLQGENYISHEREAVLSPGTLNNILRENPNIIAVSCVEQSCAGLNGTQLGRIMDSLRVCAWHGVYFIWEDMGYPDRKHVFAAAADDDEFYSLLKDLGDNLILVNKVNGWGQFFLTQSLAAGMWLSGLTAGWGINPEDFWWFESGFGELYAKSTGRIKYKWLCENIGSGFASQYLTAAEFSCPEALIGQMLIPAVMQGACVISFENPDRVIQCGGSLTPLFSRVISPVKDILIRESLIPSRQEMIDRTLCAICADDWECPALRLPSEELFRDLYGCTDINDDAIRAINASTRIIPHSGRYGLVPVIPVKALDEAKEIFGDRLTNASRFEGSAKASLKTRFPDNGEKTSCCFHDGNSVFITNPFENEDISTFFSNIRLSDKLFISGSLEPHTYLWLRPDGESVRLLVCNFRTDSTAAIWKNAEFSRNNYLERYLKEDKSLIGENREIKLKFSGIPVEFNAQKTEKSTNWFQTEDNDKTILSISMNGSAEFTAAPRQ